MKVLIFLALLTAATALPSDYSSNCIDGCKCKEYQQTLRIFECRQPITLNKAAFAKIDKNYAKIFALENVQISKIEDGTFSSFPILSDIVVRNSTITSIEPKAFENLHQMVTLKFEDCEFHNVPQLTTSRVEQLIFRDCNLDDVPSLRNLPALTVLSLAGNKIEYLDIVAFANLFQLQDLDLSRNSINRFSGNLFVNNKELKNLNLDENPLKFFSFNTSNSIEKLTLKSCALTSFGEENLYHLDDIEDLDLSNNRIASLPKSAFINMKSLLTIDLSGNVLSSLDADIFRENTLLQRIHLNNNHFLSLPVFNTVENKAFQIEVFTCSNCQLQELPRNFFEKMPGMHIVKLDHNHISHIDHIFQNCKSITDLDISYNDISNIAEDAFEHVLNLETINLAGNPLSELNPNVFSPNHVLSKINANQTGLTKLWTDSNIILDSLKQLIVSNNNLKSLRRSDLEKLTPNLISIDVTNNQFEATADLCSTMEWLNKQNRIIAIEPDFFEIPENYVTSNIEGVEQVPKNWDLILNVFDCSHSPMETDVDDYNDDDLSLKNDYLSNPLKNFDEDDDLDNDPFLDYASAVEEQKDSLTKVSNILSITSVFIVTALAVLLVAVTIILFIIRRNSNYNMQSANLPRFKIPLWDTQSSMKKHSGSVYRPLSEDVSGPRTPKFNRYEFAASPIVHTVSQ